MRDIKTLLIVAMLMITICVITYIIAECVKSVRRIDNELATTEKYLAAAAAESAKAEEETKQAILGRLLPIEAASGRSVHSIKSALQTLSDQLRGGG